MPRPTPLSLSAALQEGYLRYFDTAFWLRDPQLMAERGALLREEGMIFQEPLLETLLPYPPGPRSSVFAGTHLREGRSKVSTCAAPSLNSSASSSILASRGS